MVSRINSPQYWQDLFHVTNVLLMIIIIAVGL